MLSGFRDLLGWNPIACFLFPGRISSPFPPSEPHGTPWTPACPNEAHQWDCKREKDRLFIWKTTSEKRRKILVSPFQGNKERKRGFPPLKTEQKIHFYLDSRGSLMSLFLLGFLFLRAICKIICLPVPGDWRLEQTSHAKRVWTWCCLFSY